jgi:hypothetical protein
MSVNSSATINTEDIYDYVDVIFQKKYVLTGVAIVIVIYILSTLIKPSYSDKYLDKPDNSGWFISFILFLFIVFLIIVGILKFFFGINVFVDFKNVMKKEIDLIGELPGVSGIVSDLHIPLLSTSQVFNIPGNNYNYEQAQDLCKAYGAELADYSQMESAYNHGANWCNYGWSKDQLALFPTQKKTYEDLQKIKGHENDCGRPGINGGYMANPFNRYGVNCYGKKPDITDEEKILMSISDNEEVETNKDVEYWKTKIPNILISPFNSNTWSKL